MIQPLASSPITPLSPMLGTQVIVAIIIGLLLIFILQFLLTSLGLAFSLSQINFQTDPEKPAVNSAESSALNNLDKGGLLGVGLLLTLNTVLFVACFFAIRFVDIQNPISGATLGIVIWATYLLLLLWGASKTVGFFSEWLFGSVVRYLGKLLQTISQGFKAFYGPESSDLTEEQITTLVRQELNTALQSFDWAGQLQQSLESFNSPALQLDEITRDLTIILQKLEPAIATDLDQTTLRKLVTENTYLSAEQQAQLADHLEQVCAAMCTTPEQNPWRTWAEELEIEQLYDDSSTGTHPDDDHADAWWEQIDWQTVKKTLLARVDLSDIDLQYIWQYLQDLTANQDQTFSPALEEISQYLKSAPRWQLNSARGEIHFKQLIYDPEADPTPMADQLREMPVQKLTEFLTQREDLTPAEITQISHRFAGVRQEMLKELEQVESQTSQKIIASELQQCPPAALVDINQGNLDDLLTELLLAEVEQIEELRGILSHWSAFDWQAPFVQQNHLPPEQCQRLAERIKHFGNQLWEQVQDWQRQLEHATASLREDLKNYCHYTAPQYLTEANIQDKVSQLHQELLAALPSQSPQFAAVQQFLQRQTIKGAITPSILDASLRGRPVLEIMDSEAIQTTILKQWNHLVVSPREPREPNPTEQLIRDFSEKLVDYGYRLLNAEVFDLEREIPALFEMVRGQTQKSFKRQLARLDWEAIETQLQKTGHYSKAQIKRVSHKLREALAKVLKLPRRYAQRLRQQTHTISEQVGEFLHHAEPREFRSERLEKQIKDIVTGVSLNAQELVNLPAKWTPQFIQGVLEGRSDLHPEEIQTIGDRLYETLHELKENYLQRQQQVTQAIGKYLQSLELFDPRQLDWQKLLPDNIVDQWPDLIHTENIEELTESLDHWLQDTVLQALPESWSISETVLQPLATIRDYLQTQIKQLQAEAEAQVSQLQAQALGQLDQTRKAIAQAVYWLLGMGLTTTFAAAGAGYLATLGLF